MPQTAAVRLKGAVALVACYFVLNICLRLVLPDSLELDEAEQAFSSQFLLAGYGPQPPFYDWIQYALVAVTGISLLSLTVLKNAILFLGYLFYGLAARVVLKDRSMAGIVMLSLITLPQVAFMAQRDLTHTVAVIFAASLFLYGLFRLLDRGDTGSYLIVGIATGIGLISKYNFALLPLSAFLAVLLDPDFRRRLLEFRLLIVIVIAALIVLPHAIWLLGNLELASAGTLEKMVDARQMSWLAVTGKGLLSLVVAVLAFSALTVALLFAAFRGDFLRAIKAETRWTRLIGRMMLISLIAVVIIILATNATHIRERWLTPFLMVLPLYIFLKIEASGIDMTAGLRRFFVVVPVLMTVVLLSLYLRTAGGSWIGEYTKLNVPFAAFARSAAAEQKPALIIAADQYTAGNMRIQLPHTPIITPRAPSKTAPAGLASLGPVLVVWAADEGADPTMPEELADFLRTAGIAPETLTQHTLALPYYYGRVGDVRGFGYLWLPAS